MPCGCVYVDDSSSPDFYSDKVRKARKPYTCCECAREIKPGEIYEAVAGRWEGDFNTYKTCIECLEIRSAFFCDGWIFTEVFSDLWEHINDMDGNIPESCLADLSKESRETVCEFIERVWEKINEQREKEE